MSLSMHSNKLKIFAANKIKQIIENRKKHEKIKENYKEYLKNFKSNNENKFFKY
jgi:hypothetical protein